MRVGKRVRVRNRVRVGKRVRVRVRMGVRVRVRGRHLALREDLHDPRVRHLLGDVRRRAATLRRDGGGVGVGLKWRRPHVAGGESGG